MTRWLTRHPLELATAALLAVAPATACGGEARAFRADDTVVITSPTPLTTVAAPFTVTWRASTGYDGAFGVFVDREPIAPGRTVRDLAADQCKRVSNCQPTRSYLAGLGVYVTTGHGVTVATLQLPSGMVGKQAHPLHEATIVLMDRAGRRVGDAAWQVEFRG